VRGGSEIRGGVLTGLAAYLLWGFFPAFFKALSPTSPTEILAHRIVWSAVFLGIFLTVSGRLKTWAAAFSDLRMVLVLAATTCFLAINWFTFLIAVGSGRVLQSSLGYFINPLVSILLGAVILRERLTARQKASILLAAAGVLIQTVMVGSLPVISLILAFSFGSYGLVRKAARIPPLSGLAVEMTFMFPLAVIYLWLLIEKGQAAFLGGNTRLDILLVLCGVVTATPLILYGRALNHLRLSTVGIMQFIVPTGHFLLAVFAYGEPFTTGHMASFALIWAALFLYISDTFPAVRPAPPEAI